MLIAAKLLSLLVGGAIANNLWKSSKSNAIPKPAPRDEPTAVDAEPEIVSVRAAVERAERGQTAPISAEEIEEKSRFTTSVAACTLLTGAVAFPPLIVAGLPFLGAAVSNLVQRPLENLREGRRVGTSLLDLANGVVIVTVGHFLAISVCVASYHLYRWMLVRTEDHSHKNVIDAFGLLHQPVWVVVEEEVVERTLSSLEAGDVVVVRAGRMVPVDGEVVGGRALLDQGALTGESQPIERGVGEQVLASTVVIKGGLRIRATETGEETLAAQIAEMMATTDDFRSTVLARGERIIDRCAWPTLTASALTAPILGLQSALAMLYTGFGWHMRMGAPISILNYLGLAAESQILVKDGRSLELLADVDTVVFDKTGTLTEEVPSVGRVVSLGEFQEDELLALVAAAERHQDHPIASSLLREAKNRGLVLPEVEAEACHLGLGLDVRLGDRRLLIGSARLMENEGVELPGPSIKAESAGNVATVIYVALDGQLTGIIELIPTIRPEAARVVAELRARGKALYILSGDREAPTRALADALGIVHVFADTLPQDKARVIEELQAEGRSVCYIGDGINDAIALKSAHVSISLRGATTVAVDTAGIVLLDESLSKLLPLFDLSLDMKRNLDRSTALTIGPSLLSAFGVLFLGMGIPAVVGIYQATLVAVIANGMLPRLGHDAPAPGEQPDRHTDVDEQVPGPRNGTRNVAVAGLVSATSPR